MKIVVIGGSGLIGSRVIAKLRERGHDAIDGSPKSGVNSITGQGLAVVVCLSTPTKSNSLTNMLSRAYCG